MVTDPMALFPKYTFTIYCLMAAPPSEEGVQLTVVAARSLEVAVTFVGASGTVAGVAVTIIESVLKISP